MSVSPLHPRVSFQASPQPAASSRWASSPAIAGSEDSFSLRFAGKKPLSDAQLAKKLEELKAEAKLKTRLGEARATLSFEMQTWPLGGDKILPPAAMPARGGQLSALATMTHRVATSKKLGSLLATLGENIDRLSPDDQKLVRVMREDFDESAKLPESFVQRSAELRAKAGQVWDAAYHANGDKGDFAQFAPILGELVELQREQARIYKPDAKTPYDALLDAYEPGMTIEKLDKLFGDLKRELTPMIRKIAEAEQVDDTPTRGHSFSARKQYQAIRDLVAQLGFDFDRGSIATATHPFSTRLGPNDHRITIRTRERNLWDGLAAAAHEGGHGKYEQGIDQKWHDTPVAHGTSLGIHESQSRLHELMVASNRPFLSHLLPKLQAIFPKQLGGVSLEDFYRAINKVEPSFIRVEADEVTYTMHVIIRYEIEKALINGELAVEDIPEAWNAKMKEYLGVDVTSDSQGCLQDVHWSMGAFGYFPTYTLGTMGAAQFFHRLQKDIPDLDKQLAEGDLTAVTAWLNENVHKDGRADKPDEIYRRATGEPLNAKYLLSYLKEKYSEIYGIKL